MPPKEKASYRLNIRGREFDLNSPRVMGVLNVTPDSFYDGGVYNHLESAIGHIGLMVSQGADIIDIGGESTRPGSDPVSGEVELERVLPVIEWALEKFPETLFSIDTTKYRVAREALEAGVHVVNDISGLQREPRLADLCTSYNAGYILMHSQGNPKTMQHNPEYDDPVKDIELFFEQQLNLAKAKGLENIILDPGIGFGKTQDHNLEIIANLDKFLDLGCPLMIGASRKSLIGRILNDRPVDDRVTGTVAVHYHTMMLGARLIRVHDVKEGKDSVQVFNAISGFNR